VGYIGLFPAVFAYDAEWIFRTNHLGHLVGDLAEETLRAVIRYMNAQYRLQSLKQRYMDDMVNLAQDFHMVKELLGEIPLLGIWKCRSWRVMLKFSSTKP
jgi:hypothetical protein